MRIFLLIFALSFLTNCAVNPVTGKQDFVVISENQEIQMGREYNAQILRQNPVYQDQELQDYVQAIGESLAAKSHRPNLIYRFTILDSPDINAFALPGGYIYINRGLMSYLSSEEELAAVLGRKGATGAGDDSKEKHSGPGIAGAREADPDRGCSVWEEWPADDGHAREPLLAETGSSKGGNPVFNEWDPVYI